MRLSYQGKHLERGSGRTPHPALRATFPSEGKARETGDGLPRRFAPRNDMRERGERAANGSCPSGNGRGRLNEVLELELETWDAIRSLNKGIQIMRLIQDGRRAML